MEENVQVNTPKKSEDEISNLMVLYMLITFILLLSQLFYFIIGFFKSPQEMIDSFQTPFIISSILLYMAISALSTDFITTPDNEAASESRKRWLLTFMYIQGFLLYIFSMSMAGMKRLHYGFYMNEGFMPYLDVLVKVALALIIVVGAILYVTQMLALDNLSISLVMMVILNVIVMIGMGLFFTAEENRMYHEDLFLSSFYFVTVLVVFLGYLGARSLAVDLAKKNSGVNDALINHGVGMMMSCAIMFIYGLFIWLMKGWLFSYPLQEGILPYLIYFIIGAPIMIGLTHIGLIGVKIITNNFKRKANIWSFVFAVIYIVLVILSLLYWFARDTFYSLIT
ncbi:hypothetical protein [Alkalihalobacillus pseudalcaliphilus]|uniref:hypothetical protein n=1 Tax=Alkalihalobacillus pseudalcaliphilus TaxID=79884 RepID=UPI00064DFA4D|nr:hypothetical protein [Alkalihalobacillus pseudalcaliphilus]KMK78006.1 hypothetical protein AB990_00700 [Alkalihalobacillus pseudalcaliphilus]